MSRGIPDQPPAPLPPRPFAFPAPVVVPAPWGGEIAVARVRTIPVVHVRFAAATGTTCLPGAATDVGRLVALGRLLAPTLRHGIGDHDAPSLAAHLDRLGARLSLSVGLDQAVASASGFATALPALLSLVATAVTEVRAPAAAFEIERQKALQVLHHHQGDPDAQAAMWLGHALYGRHPYASPMPTAAALARIRPDDIPPAWQALFPGRQTQLLIVGDVDPEAAVAAALDRFAALCDRADQPVPSPVAPAPRPTAPRVVGVVRPDSEQLSIQTGLRLFPRSHPDHLPLRMAHQVLGAGAGSRLFLRLREAEGLTYDAWSNLDCGVLGGELSCGLSAAPDRAEAATRGLQRELQALVDSPPTADELASAARQIAGSFPGKASGVGGVSLLLALAWRQGFPPADWSDYPARVLGMSAARVQAAVEAHVHPAQASTVVVGPEAAVDAALAVLPPGRKVDLDARPD